MAISVSKAGRAGGRSRMWNQTAERRREIASRGWDGRAYKKLYGMTKRAFGKRLVEKIRESNADLGWWIQAALRAPRHIAVHLAEGLRDEWIPVIERAMDDVIAEAEQELKSK